MKYLTILAFFASVLFLGSCSGEQPGSDSLEIELYGIDQMKYVVKEKADYLRTGTEYLVNDETYYLLTGINAAPGRQIDLELTTISQIPPSAMSHNWLLLDPEADPETFSLESGSARDNNYIAPDMQDMVLAQTGMVGGGKSATVSFSAPDSTGEYDYVCTFPGHFTGGMKGVLYVEKSTE